MKKKISLLLLSLSLIFSCNNTSTPNTSNSAIPNSSSSPTSSNPSSSPSNQPTVSAPTSFSCEAEPTLTIGQEFDKTIFEKLTCNAKIKVGTKWVYSSSTIAGTIDSGVEITAIKDGMVTSKIDIIVNGSKQTKEYTSKYGGGYVDQDQDTLKFTYQGKEDVTVPSGSYPQAYKITTSKTQQGFTVNLTYYIAKDVGAVKVISEMNNIPVIGSQKTEVVLKEFKL
ncbi:MAG: hypothetical protein U0457_01260 [Candidatus Sericytochromatia bacterium]